MLKIRRSLGRLIFEHGNPHTWKEGIHIESGPSSLPAGESRVLYTSQRTSLLLPRRNGSLKSATGFRYISLLCTSLHPWSQEQNASSGQSEGKYTCSKFLSGGTIGIPFHVSREISGIFHVFTPQKGRFHVRGKISREMIPQINKNQHKLNGNFVKISQALRKSVRILA